MNINTDKIYVKKFGGTSVGSIERIESIADRLKKDFDSGQRPIVVSSAMAGETNRLIELMGNIDPNYRGPAYDMLLSSGEQVSISLLSVALKKRGLHSQPLLAFQLGLKTDSFFSKARIINIDTKKLKSLLDQSIIPVVAGFQGVDVEENITTLGRGGSDTTAVALAAALGLKVCEIYTDVIAVYTSDPRIVSKVKKIEKISFDEMMEMASLGSKVLHTRCVEMAKKFNVRIHLRSSFVEEEGTWILPEEEIMEQPLVSSVAYDAKTVVIKLFPIQTGLQFITDLFKILTDAGVVVDIITQSESEEGHRLAFSIDKDDLFQTKELLQSLLNNTVIQMNVLEEMAKVSVVGVGMRNHPGVAYNFFAILNELGIPVHLVTTSEIKISAVIPKSFLELAVRKLHTKFNLDS